MSQWAEEGFSPAEFWQQTPRSFLIIMEGRLRARRRRWEELVAQAWHTEAFARRKSLPSLSKVLSGEEKQAAKAQTPTEMVAAMRAWVQHTTVH